jgi:hypothetical protein
MPLLDKLAYKKLLVGKGVQRDPANIPWDQVLQFVESHADELQLKRHAFDLRDASVVYQFGPNTLCHVRAVPDERNNVFIIVILNENAQLTDYILIDLGAEYAPISLDGPQIGYVPDVTEEDIKNLIPQIDPDESDPFAVLASPDGGTYIQTYREPDGFVLEYQLVNVSSHYRVPELLTAEQVVRAMLSYGWGRDEWLSMFTWERVEL